MAVMHKRFYDKADIETREDGFAVTLDGRAVKTPARRDLLLPTRELAQNIAQEFCIQKEKIDPTTMPMTRLANTIIDGIVDNNQAIAEDMMRFIAADMLFYRAESPLELIERQRAAFDPILDFIEAKFSSHFNIGEQLTFIAQPREALFPIRNYINAITSPFTLGGLHTITTLTASGLIAIALKETAIEADRVWSIAHIEEDWTAEQWGQDEEALQRRSFRRREFDAALAFLSIPHQNAP